MATKTKIFLRIILGLLGSIIFAIGGTLVLFSLHWIIWNAPGTLNPPSPIEWLVHNASPLGFFLFGIGSMMILWSKPA